MKFFLSKEDRIHYLGFDDWWVMPLAIPLVAGIASLIFMSAISVNGEVSDVICYSAGLTYTVIFWVINRFSVVNLRHYFPRQEQTPRRIGYMVLVALIAVFVVKGGIDRVEKLFIPVEKTDYVEPSVLFSVAVSFTLCLLVLAIYESIYFFTKYRSSLLEQERLAKQNMQAQLSVLKQQVNPHFLFNSLNTLTNIIPEDPPLATRFVQRLAAVYRRILEYRHRELITLGEEFTALQDYVFLMLTRFEEKLNVKVVLKEGDRLTQVQCLWNTAKPGKASSDKHMTYALPDLPPHLNMLKVVPLSVQLLVENAIKHNVISNEQPLSIQVIIAEDYLEVKNNLQLRRRQLHSTGLGQQNIRQRYRLISDQPVFIESNENQYSVRIPLLQPETSPRYATA